MLKLPWNLNDTATKDLFEKEETFISKRSERFLETETNLDRINALKKSYTIKLQFHKTHPFSTSKFAINQLTSVRQIICNVQTALNSRIFTLREENVLRLRPVAR